MVKEIVKLFAVFGVMGGIAVGPSLVKTNAEVFEPNLELPTVGTYENLLELVEQSNNTRDVYFGGIVMKDSLNISDFATTAGSLKQEALTESKVDYSTTNVQVEGVDEADIIKTDGKYLYHLLNDKLVISEIYPVNSMNIVSEVTYADEFNPIELYVEGDMVIVIGSEYKYKKRYYGEDYTKIIIYNADDKSELKIEREVEISGIYNSSRKINNSLYLVAQKYIRTYNLDDKDYDVLPYYKDSALNSELRKEITCEEIRYFPGFECTQYMMTVGVNLEDLSKEAQISTYLGNCESIYASEDNMYITFTSYKSSDAVPLEDELMLKRVLNNYSYNQNTSIYRFKLENGEMNCKATGEVKGSILNQFSMDENNGYFRIATTNGNVTGVGEQTSKNNIYVLDKDLKLVGSIEDIAPGEKIYSVRYMGDRAYMVTFRKVDPLFVIDLSNPETPNILGKLKIPGYSDYLHPYDEKHIIGFGKDAAVVSDEEGSWGWADEDGTAAYYQGMKIALFDVTDPTNPIEMWKEEIGDRGTESELLYNHKALLFSKDKNLLAFPIKVATIDDENAKAWSYGDTTFVGAYVYELTLDKGFVLKAKLTDLTETDWKRIGGYYYGDKIIDRLIYINDVIYTISDYGYSAYNLNDFSKINTLEIK